MVIPLGSIAKRQEASAEAQAAGHWRGEVAAITKHNAAAAPITKCGDSGQWLATRIVRSECAMWGAGGGERCTEYNGQDGSTWKRRWQHTETLRSLRPPHQSISNLPQTRSTTFICRRTPAARSAAYNALSITHLIRRHDHHSHSSPLSPCSSLCLSKSIKYKHVLNLGVLQCNVVEYGCGILPLPVKMLCYTCPETSPPFPPSPMPHEMPHEHRRTASALSCLVS